MSRTALTVQSIGRNGLTPSYAAANTDGHYIPNDGRMFMHVKNGGDLLTVTIQTPGTVDGMAVADRTVTVAATTGEKMIGPFPPSQYNQISCADVGSVYVDFSAVASVTVAAFRLEG